MKAQTLAGIGLPKRLGSAPAGVAGFISAATREGGGSRAGGWRPLPRAGEGRGEGRRRAPFTGLLGLAGLLLALALPAVAQTASTPIAVLPLGLTEATHQRYPQLAERSVGFGIHNLLVNALAEAGEFRFVEDKPDVVKDLLDRQWTAASGAVAADSAVAYGRLTGARYVVYGEVYDFATQRLKRKKAEVRIAIQVRWIDVETSEYIPASGTATLTREGQVFPKQDDTAFARSTVGLASEAAIREAIQQLMRRLPAAPGGNE